MHCRLFSALARTGRREETPHNLSARLVGPTVLHDASRRECLKNAAWYCPADKSRDIPESDIILSLKAACMVPKNVHVALNNTAVSKYSVFGGITWHTAKSFCCFYNKKKKRKQLLHWDVALWIHCVLNEPAFIQRWQFKTQLQQRDLIWIHDSISPAISQIPSTVVARSYFQS